MSDRISHDSNDIGRTLSEIGDDYLQLIGADRSIADVPNTTRNCRWTGIVSTEHFAIAGCVENSLEDDLADAWQDIDSLFQSAAKPWKFIFNAKDHELPATASDVNDFRLPASELERLGKQVTQLRELVRHRAEAIKATSGDFRRLPETSGDFRKLPETSAENFRWR